MCLILRLLDALDFEFHLIDCKHRYKHVKDSVHYGNGVCAIYRNANIKWTSCHCTTNTEMLVWYIVERKSPLSFKHRQSDHSVIETSEPKYYRRPASVLRNAEAMTHESTHYGNHLVDEEANSNTWYKKSYDIEFKLGNKIFKSSEFPLKIESEFPILDIRSRIGREKCVYLLLIWIIFLRFFNDWSSHERTKQ